MRTGNIWGTGWYEAALNRASELEGAVDDAVPQNDQERQARDSLKVLGNDVPRTWSNFRQFRADVLGSGKKGKDGDRDRVSSGEDEGSGTGTSTDVTLEAAQQATSEGITSQELTAQASAADAASRERGDVHGDEQSLSRVLRSIVRLRPDLGYTQGLNFIAAFIMLVLSFGGDSGHRLERRAAGLIRILLRCVLQACRIIIGV